MDRFLDDSEDLQVRVSDVTVDGDEATVRVRYRTPGRWDEGDLGFERGDDGRWRLQALPECAMDGEE